MKSLISKVNCELENQIVGLPKMDITQKSLENYGKSILCESIEECIEIANMIAPEHLELMVNEPMKIPSIANQKCWIDFLRVLYL